MKRALHPHISVTRGLGYNSVTGWVDLSRLSNFRWWECKGHGVRGDGRTPKDAYESWYKRVVREYNAGYAI